MLISRGEKSMNEKSLSINTSKRTFLNMKDIGRFREFGLLIFVVIISIMVQIRNPKFLTLENIDDLIKNTTILSILAIGMMLVIITRGIDLSIGATIAL